MTTQLSAYSSKEVLNARLSHRMLDTSEENRLLLLASAGDKEALDDLVNCNQRFIASIVRRYNYAVTANDLEVQDLFQAGNMGLMKAIEKWSPDRGAKFTTYAFYWVRFYIRRMTIMRSLPLSISHVFAENYTRIRQARGSFVSKFGRDPALGELSQLTGLSEQDIKQYDVNCQVISINGFEDNTTYTDESRLELPDETQDTAGDAERNVLLEQLHTYIVLLPKGWQVILNRHFGLDGQGGEDAACIARDLGVSRQYVARVLIRAISQLRLQIVFGQKRLC